jgi:hypothetical protein
VTARKDFPAGWKCRALCTFSTERKIYHKQRHNYGLTRRTINLLQITIE